MISIAIQVLWFLIGLIILCGVIWLVIFVIEKVVMPIPERVKQAVWVIVLLLAIIALLTALVGGGGQMRFPSLKGQFGEPGRAVASVSTSPAGHLPRLLTARA